MSPSTLLISAMTLTSVMISNQALAGELSAPQVQSLVEDALRDGARSVDGRIEQVVLRNTPTLSLPTPEHRVKVLLRDGEDFTGVTPVELRVEKDGQIVKRIWINTRIVRKVPLLRVSHRVPSGQVLQNADLELVEVDATRRPPNALTAIEEALGMTTRTTMAAGRALTRGYVRKPLAIKRGALVGIEVSTGTLRIRAQGRAEGAGGIGETIPVLNLGSKRTLRGRIINPNTVIVEP